MKRRLSVALVVWLGLWLWPADRASAADAMYGGGVSSSGSQPWIGGHNNMPRQTLSPVGTVFTPPTSFGNFWILNNAASQTVACPPDVADGDSMIVHLQYGSGAPYSPAISFSPVCYGWTTGTQPSWSEVSTQSDSAFCQSMNPPDVTGASFVCAPQLNVAPPTPPPPAAIAHVQSFGVNTGTGTGNQTTGAFTAAAAGQSVLCMLTIDAGNFINTMVDSASNSYTLGTSSSGPASNTRYAYAINITGAPTSFTFNLSSSGLVRAECDTFVNATAIRTAVNSALQGSSITPSQAITGVSINDMLWSGINSGVTASAGSGFTLGNNNLTSINASTEYGLATSAGTVNMTWSLGSGGGASNITSLALAPATAWDLVHKNSTVTISGAGNLIATASGASADKAGYANNFHSTGKFSFAVTATSVASSIGIGLGNSSGTTTTFCGNDGNSICYYASGSVVTNNGVGVGNTSGLPTFATGNKIWIAVHFTGTQTNLWVNKSAGAPGTSGWVGNGGTSGNPDTDTNPIVFNSTAAVSPAYDLSVSGDKVTADFLTPSGLATYSTW